MSKDDCIKVVDCRKKKPPKCPKKEPPCLPKKKERQLVAMPHILRIIGPKHISIALAFVPTLFRYGTAALIFLIYGTEFRTLLQYLPLYNGKYNDEEEASKKSSKKKEAAQEDPAKAESLLTASKDC